MLVPGSSRARVSGNVADPITAAVLVIESVDEGKPPGMVVLVSCDLLYIVNPLRDRA